jgi:hypothetical protein
LQNHNIAGRLFKFSAPTDYALHNLKTAQIFCQHYAAYNDPFEFWTSISSGVPSPDQEPERYLAALQAWGFDCHTITEASDDPAINDFVDGYFDECHSYAPPFEIMRQEMRISCFSSEADNLLMWSHYGDGLRGFCVMFDEASIMQGDAPGYILDVAYLDTPPQVDSFIYGVAWDQDWYSHVAIEETESAIRYQGRTDLQGDIEMYKASGAEALRTMRTMWQHVFATKPAEWKYERERRLLVQTRMTDMSPLLRGYSREAVKEVIIGERMPDNYRDRLLAVLREHYPNAMVRTARRAQGAYTLAII